MMAIRINSYGSVVGIEGLVPRWVNDATPGIFDTTTTPPLAFVEGLIDQVSSVLNSILSQEGFTIPLTQADSVLMLGMFVEQEAAAVVEGINGSGRFGPTAKEPGKSRFNMIFDDAQKFISDNATGLANLGAARPNSTINSIAFRETDESGDQVNPIFQRKGYGNRFQDWDPSS